MCDLSSWMVACDEDDEVVRQSKMLAASSKAEIGYVRSDELEAGSFM